MLCPMCWYFPSPLISEGAFFAIRAFLTHGAGLPWYSFCIANRRCMMEFYVVAVMTVMKMVMMIRGIEGPDLALMANVVLFLSSGVGGARQTSCMLTPTPVFMRGQSHQSSESNPSSLECLFSTPSVLPTLNVHEYTAIGYQSCTRLHL